MAQSQVFFDAPLGSLFQFPPDAMPHASPTPHRDLPFTIPDRWFQAALNPKVPITIALLYTVSAKSLNAYNRSTNKRPWAISKTRAFHVFVILHNVFLAVYSAWTFWGMLTALRNSIVSPSGPNGWSGTVDSFCQMHGPAGLGNAVVYNQDRSQWQSLNGSRVLTLDGSPSRTDTGRIWNEGLAFYGWIFYLSKFYEVLDTFIILAKGKQSSTLQTYHHAGAMMCMWAGIRYMAVPIWVFAFVNSFIHAMMYTYFTITAFNIRVPTWVKRTLTSLQITQFLVGASYAMLHSFVYYTVPVQGPATRTTTLLSSMAEAAFESPSANPLMGSLKQMLFGAAEAANAAAIASPSTSTGERASEMHYEVVPCIGTSGSTFAVWLNVLYLAPLTYLFVSFFVASYLKRSTAEARRVRTEKKVHGTERRLSNAMHTAEKAGWDAAKSIEQEVYGQGNERNGSAVIDDSEAVMNGNGIAKPQRKRANGARPNGKKY